jgi:outer membrane protein OmpA-like peptidoglycan-associated protein
MRILVAAGVMLVLAGCAAWRPAASPAPAAAPPSAPARAPIAPPPPPRASLAAEQQRFAELFRGTPVVFAMQVDGSLRVTVPVRFSFDKGRFAVKPALAAVLDRVAWSQRAEATRLRVAVPADPRGNGLLLATERATSARDYMVGRGVDARRFSISAARNGDEVVIVVADVSSH